MKRGRRDALLVLQDGTVFAGEAIGALQTGAMSASSGEVVFNTAMSGYEEVTTDPSYAGQVIAFTTPPTCSASSRCAWTRIDRRWVRADAAP